MTACVISDGNLSTGGRYLSLTVEIIVTDDAERLRLYQQFAADPAVKMVL